MTRRPNYLVHAPSWNPDQGGSIFMHLLVHHLTLQGEDAAIWPWYRDPRPGLLTTARGILRKPSLLLGSGRRFLNPDLHTRLAGLGDLRPETIVVYPEIRLGNPLEATNVVRWLLYKPGLQHRYQFTDDEMFFRVGEICDMPDITGGAQDLVMWQRNRVYRNEQRPDRHGACYLVRKGQDKPRIAETQHAICIDGKSHEEVADIFNRCTTFYSYDEASFYSQYAAICGCDSVVVPGLYASREEWTQAHHVARYGVAYGLEDIDHARATRPLVEGLLAEKEEEGRQSVSAFIEATQERFGTKSAPA